MYKDCKMYKECKMYKTVSLCLKPWKIFVPLNHRETFYKFSKRD